MFIRNNAAPRYSFNFYSAASLLFIFLCALSELRGEQK
ncbi:hypothetical protein D1AOALGA4SA_7375 [Olavius algarvensis Delta 1 endosymbiont]|nr:hypothetical protein D1AOALGA4SA_7375 [Olavius algarvensis Delta 1 endosymbiont]